MPTRLARLRAAGFTCIAAYSAYHWFALTAEPPLLRWGGVVALAALAALTLEALGAARRSPVTRTVLAVATALAALAGVVLVTGVPLQLLAPGSWGELRAELAAGLTGVSQVELPYAGSDPWTRLGIMLAAPPVLIVAAATAFWPTSRGVAARRAIALVLLLALYGTAVTWKAPPAELARGVGLLVVVAAYLWLPRIRLRRAVPAIATALLAAALALPAAAAVNADKPWIKYTRWTVFGAQKSASFDWDHRYGPLDWPQEGRLVLEIRSERPLLWRTTVLDSFDGQGWLRRSDGGDLPGARDSLAGASPRLLERNLRRDWTRTFDVEVGELDSQSVVGAGTLRTVEGIPALITADGTAIRAGGPLRPGDSYSATAYAPDPRGDQLRGVPDRYPPVLARYTSLTLPGAAEADAPIQLRPRVTVPLRGSGGDVDSVAAVAAGTPYERVWALSDRLTDGKGAYEAARSIERYLAGDFRYRQDVPERRYPLAAFLLRDRAGYCQQFSGAMALMLRMGGIPARVAAGFSPGSRNPGTDLFSVRDTDAHSWVEVWFRGIGWVPFDPTPASAPAAAQSLGVLYRSGELSGFDADRVLGIEQAAEAGRTAGSAAPPAATEGSALDQALTTLAAAAGLAAGWVYLRRRRRLLRPQGTEAQLLELERALSRLGFQLPAGVTLLELEGRLQGRGADGGARYVRALRLHRFAPGRPRRPGLEERASLRKALACGGPLRRLRAWRALPPGGPRRMH